MAPRAVGEHPGGKASLDVTVGTRPSSVPSLAGARTRRERRQQVCPRGWERAQQGK